MRELNHYETIEDQFPSKSDNSYIDLFESKQSVQVDSQSILLDLATMQLNRTLSQTTQYEQPTADDHSYQEYYGVQNENGYFNIQAPPLPSAPQPNID